MPTYDYVCRACDHRFEKFQSMSERPSRKCPECGELRLRRLLGAGSGVIFKGSGFYETDYKRKSGGNGSVGGGDSSGTNSGTPKGDGTKKESAKKSGDD